MKDNLKNRNKCNSLIRFCASGLLHLNPKRLIFINAMASSVSLMSHANAFEKDIIRTAYHSLARASELRRLKISDCDFTNGKVWFYTRKRQGGSLEGDKIDINKSLREILYRRCKLIDSEYVFPEPDGTRLKKNSLDKIMPRLCHKINFDSNNKPKPRKEQIKPFGLHSIRHHVAANLFMNYNYSVYEVKNGINLVL